MSRTIENERIEGLDLSGRTETGLRLIAVELVTPDLANLRAHDGALVESTLTGGRLTGASWYGGSARDVVLRDCRADLAGFALARLARTAFERCDLRESDFQGAQLTRVAFAGCDLRGADFSDARFVQCRMTDCRLDGVRLDRDLSGLAMPWPDVVGAAATLAAALGLELLDDDAG